MQDDRGKYGTDFTSVKVHQSPGGNSSLSLAWEEPQRRRQGGREAGGRGQSWDNQPSQIDRGPARNPGRAYPEPRPSAQAPSYPDPRAQPPQTDSRPQGYAEPRGQPPQKETKGYQAYGGGYRAQQDPEPAFRADLPWREEAGAQYQAGEQRRKQVDERDPRYAPRPIPRPREPQYEERVYVARNRPVDPAEERVYVPRPRPVEPLYEDRVYVPRPRPTDHSYDSRPEEQYFGKADPPNRAEPPYPGRAEPQYSGRAEAQYPGYQSKLEPSQVHTSVKVREPPGGRTNFTFG